MECFICVTCGSQFAPSAAPPPACPICLDERQYVGHQGQRWTTMAKLQADGVRTVVKEEEPGLLGIGAEPGVGIGQRALLVRTGAGNILWDCISLLDAAAIEAVQAAGGIRSIAVSHPHFYTSMVEWAERFDARILLPAADRRWVMRPSERITFWEGDTLALDGGFTLLRLGGHFPGSSALHWPGGAGGRGALLCGDTIQVVSDRDWVSFMYSYPNLIPLPAAEVRRIAEGAARLQFARIYGGWFDRVVTQDGRAAVLRSAERYERALQGIPAGHQGG